MSSPQRPLTGFEERLLAELRRVVVIERPAPAAREPVSPARFRFSRRVALVGGVAAVLAVASAAGVPFLLGGDGVAPAYAVTPNADGTVTVEIESLRDAAGLERQLREAGIPAAVQYLPPGKACREPSFTPASGGAGGGRVGSSIQGSSGGSVRFTIDPGAIAPGQTLVIYTQELSVPSDQLPPDLAGQPGQASVASSIAIAWTEGEVGECELVDADDALPGPGQPPTAAGGAARGSNGGPVLHTAGAMP